MKKGQAEMLDWFPRIILMAIAVIIIVMLVRVYTSRDVEAPDLHRGVYLYRLYYDDIIMYKDERTGRVYPGVVELPKVTGEKLNRIFSEREPNAEWSKISSLITVTPEQGCGMSELKVYNNELTYRKFEQQTNWQLKGAATREDVVFPVTLREGTRTCAGKLNISIVRPNT
jgi:hypothetical protein